MKLAKLLASVLVLLHLIVAFAGFVAPYDPVQQVRSVPFAPPTGLHFWDASGEFHLRPFVYAQVPEQGNYDAYVDDTSQRVVYGLDE